MNKKIGLMSVVTASLLLVNSIQINASEGITLYPKDAVKVKIVPSEKVVKKEVSPTEKIIDINKDTHIHIHLDKSSLLNKERMKLLKEKMNFLVEKEKLERARAEIIITAKLLMAEKIKFKKEKEAFAKLKREVLPVKAPVAVKAVDAVQPVKAVAPVVTIVKSVKVIKPIESHSPVKSSKIEFKVTNIGDKSIGEIIKTAVGTSATPKKVEAPFDYKLEPKQVAENVWCFFGALDKPTKENAGNMANNCYIRTNDGYLVMDTGPSYQFAKQAYQAMQKIADLPVKYVVNSHEHDDHWLGNGFYKKKFNATLIGPESINTDYKEGDKTRMYNILPANAIKGTHIIKLDKTPKKPYTILLGGEEFQIIPMPIKAHTRDDIFIYMPKRKVVFAGDLVMNGRITSGRDGSVMGQLKALDMLKKLDWKVLVPGHGFITDGTAMNEAEQYFTLTKERVLEALEDGIDATEITEKVTLPEFKDKAMYDILNAQNIGFAFDELEMLDE